MAAVISAHPSGSWSQGLYECSGPERHAPSDFPSWSSLLPSAVSHDHEDHAMYVKTRSVHNRSFFEDVRNELISIEHGLRLRVLTAEDEVQTSGAATGTLDPAALISVHRSILQALHIAKGFLGNREQHKSMIIYHLCAEVADHLGCQMAPDKQLFWQMLTRLCLADAYARFSKLEESMAILLEAINLSHHIDVQPAGDELANPTAKVLEAACRKVLCRVFLEASLGCHDDRQERVDDASKEVTQAVDLLEQYFPQVPGQAEKRADAAAALATAYSSKGVCEVRGGRFDEALVWFAKAQHVLKDFSFPGNNAERIVNDIAEQIEHANHLQKFS